MSSKGKRALIDPSNDQALVSGEERTDVENPPAEPIISIRDLVKRFRRESGEITTAVDGVSVDLMPGEFLVLLGPSGCGKTTLLRAVAGLERPDGGTIRMYGSQCFSSEDGINVATERRRLSMIFQSYALWPHMTVFDNVAYPLRSRGRERSKTEIAEAVDRVLTMVQIPDLARQYPGQMSGGQQQRVALARSLVEENEVILFDEPLSNVDAKVREQLRFELVAMQRELGFAAVYVTHDQSEAMGLAHRIAVMGEGKVMQVGTPRDVYERASSRYVANFVGTSNEVPGSVVSVIEDGRTAEVRTDIGTFHGVVTDLGVTPGTEVYVVWRPEHARTHAGEPSGPNRLCGRLEASLYLGSYVELGLTVGERRFRVWEDPSYVASGDSHRWISVDPERVQVLVR